MVTIGQAKKVFRDEVCPMMTAETKADFQKAKKRINERYTRYIRTAKPVLKLRKDVYFIPDQCHYNGSHGQKVPTVREILTRENILQFEHDMESLNMFMCAECKECHLESKPPTKDLMHICQACKK